MTRTFNLKDYRTLGTIEINENTMVVADPCYYPQDNAISSIKNMKNGTYQCMMSNDNLEMMAYNVDYLKDESEMPDQEYFLGKLGVDSGMMGFYNKAYYYDVKQNREVGEKWYDEMLRNGLLENREKVEEGKWFISATGGDGSFEMYQFEENGETIAVRVHLDSEDWWF